MATTRTSSKRTTVKKTAARKARPVAKKARAVKKTAARTTRPAAKQARAAKKTAARKARPVAKKAQSVKKTAARKARPVAKKARSTIASVTRPSPAQRKAKAGARSRVRVDGIMLLKQDHREVETLFKRFEHAGKSAAQSKRKIVDQVIEALSLHAGIEELVFYPAVRREVAGSTDDVLEAIEEHHVVKLLLSELEGLAPSDERFDAKVTVLIENVRHHVKEEETELFPEVRERLGRARLLAIGDELRAARPGVPSRPHPYAPDSPPANAIIGGAVAALDRARNVGKNVVDRVLDN